MDGVSLDADRGDTDRAGVDRLRLVAIRLARAIRTNAVEELTPSQVAVLGTVVRHAPVTIGRIAELEHVKPPSVSKIVTALESKGHVDRAPDRDDRRCVHIVPTDAGIAYVETVRTAGRTWLAERLSGLDAADREAIAVAVPALERLLAGAGDAVDAASRTGRP